MQELEQSIQKVDAKIHHTEATLKDLRKLQDQISTKTAERSTLFKEQQKQYAALAEENEGLSLHSRSSIKFVSVIFFHSLSVSFLILLLLIIMSALLSL